MSRIFISYRRDDSLWVQRLADHLGKHFPPEQVFLDIEGIRSDTDFREVLDRVLAPAAVMLVVIGPQWLTAADKGGRRRIDSPTDFVHQEVAEGLRRPGVRVIPLLVGGTRMPAVEDLPEPFKSLAERQALELTVDHWDNDISRLVQTLKHAPGLAAIPVSNPRTAGTDGTHPLQRSPSRSDEPARPVASVVSRHGSDSPILFLCYRREDTSDAAGRLHDRLVDIYGAHGVFMDIDSVPLGIDFVDHVSDQISKCRAVIVMIGRQWIKVKDKRRRRRLDNEDDLVRAEIAAALQQKVPVIPVLVQDAAMPSADELPENIRLLARRNGISLSASRWRTDVERLIKELDPVMKR